jgi:plasmid replication initiation protein
MRQDSDQRATVPKELFESTLKYIREGKDPKEAASIAAKEYQRKTQPHLFVKDKLKPQVKREGGTAISEEQKSKIDEAYKLGLSSNAAGRYAGVNQSTVLKHWNNKEEMPDYIVPKRGQISPWQISRMEEAIKLKMDLKDAAKHAAATVAQIIRHIDKMNKEQKTLNKPDK